MSNVKLPGSNIFDYQMQINTSNQKNDVSLSKQFQQHLTKEHFAKILSLIRENEKLFMEIKWTYRQYHVKYNADISHKDVKMYCDTNQLPSLSFCGPHYKPHDARGG